MRDATTSPKCSYCGYELDDEETWYTPDWIGSVSTGDCDKSELICPNLDCKKTFHVRCVHKVEFIQVDENDNEI